MDINAIMTSSSTAMFITRLIFAGFGVGSCVMLVGSAITGIRLKPTQYLLLVLLAPLAWLLIRTFHLTYFGMQSYILILILVLTYRYVVKVRFMIAALTVLLGEIVWDVVEALVLDFRLVVTGMSKIEVFYNMTFTDNIYNFIYIQAICLLIFFILKRYDLNIYRLLQSRGVSIEQITNKHLITTILLLFGSIVTVFAIDGTFLAYYENFDPKIYWHLIQAVDILIFMGLSTLIVLTILGTIGHIENENHKNKAIEHLSNVENMVFSIRKQRHDFNSHLQTINALIESNEYDNAKGYIKTIIDTASSHGILIKTDNPVVSSLIYSKVGIAESEGIHIKFTIKGSLKNLPINNHSLNSIIGNLLDNAIEAMADVSSKREIVFNLERGKEFLSISTHNNCNIEKKEINLLLQPNYSTKGHSGIGLSIVKELTEKHKGILECWVEDNVIVFNSKIPLLA